MFCATFGVDAGAEEAFGGIDVADADDYFGIHEGGFDGGGFVFEGLVEVGGGEVGAQGFGAEVLEEGVSGELGGWDMEEEAEAAGVGEGDFGGGGFERDVVVFFKPWFIDGEAAGHAEMEQEGCLVAEVDEDVFGAAFHFEDGLADDLVVIFGGGLAKFGGADSEFCDGLVGKVGGGAAEGGFDFGEFGHGIELAGERRFCKRYSEYDSVLR